MEQAISFIVSFIMFQLVFLALRQRLKIKMLESEKEPEPYMGDDAITVQNVRS